MGEGEIPKEIKLARMIDRFGAQAVLGRLMGAGEINRILMAERVVRVYKSMKAASNATEWAVSNPNESQLMDYAMRLTNE